MLAVMNCIWQYGVMITINYSTVRWPPGPIASHPYCHLFITIAGFLKSKPTEADIRTHICQKAGDKWQAVCTYLAVPHSIVKLARSNNPHQEDNACFEAVMYWWSGNTNVSVNWMGLLDALKSAGLGDVANGISMQNGFGAPYCVSTIILYAFLYNMHIRM